MPDVRPLPRSLDPLPEESLPGYLLRLAHRLSLSPSRLATLTGLAAESQFASLVSSGLLLQLSETARDTFAHATRLTPAEVDGLCLASLRHRYPQASPVWEQRRSAFRSPAYRAEARIPAPARAGRPTPGRRGLRRAAGHRRRPPRPGQP